MTQNLSCIMARCSGGMIFSLVHSFAVVFCTAVNVIQKYHYHTEPARMNLFSLHPLQMKSNDPVSPKKDHPYSNKSNDDDHVHSLSIRSRRAGKSPRWLAAAPLWIQFVGHPQPPSYKSLPGYKIFSVFHTLSWERLTREGRWKCDPGVIVERTQ